ncbi:VOC family protein [Flavisphingomonas formosensis]|uniref:VOC family protein n=1 Tax=Flavisphingomonas formosensis TaxID=861534 RepID=UPI0012F80E5C|nr:VOC family protein [Sphingomonas formosensis]
MAATLRPMLMFEGRAEEAMTFYISLFADGAIEDVVRYGPDGPGTEGSVMRARFTVAGQSLLCIDSSVHHAFGFTPALSLFVDCDSAPQFEDLVASLGEGGTMLMPVGDYGFSRRFAWLNDRFGVSWQINLP